MDTILKVCKKEIIPNPKKVIYSNIIEDGIQKLENELTTLFELPNNLHRWIALKIIDGEEKLLKSIENNLSISIINNVELQLIRVKIIHNLKSYHLTSENFRDSIVSFIMKRCEETCKEVCIFENDNYSR